MRTWTMNEAKDRLAEIFRLCEEEPQIVYDQNKPVGVVVDVASFKEFMNFQAGGYRPTIAELLDELSEIHKHETAEIEVPTRRDRPNAMIEMKDELSL